MNTTNGIMTFGDIVRMNNKEQHNQRDLRAAEVYGFCQQWEALVGLPTKRGEIRKIMLRALVVCNTTNENEAELVLGLVREWLSWRWIQEDTPEAITAEKRWRKACAIEEALLMEHH